MQPKRAKHTGIGGGGEKFLSIGDLHLVQKIGDLLDRQPLRDRHAVKNSLAGNQALQNFPWRDAALEAVQPLMNFFLRTA